MDRALPAQDEDPIAAAEPGERVVAAAVALVQPLAGVEGVGLLPDVTDRQIKRAVRRYAPLLPDEVLLALVPRARLAITHQGFYQGHVRWLARLVDPLSVRVVEHRPGGSSQAKLRGLPPATASAIRSVLDRLGEMKAGGTVEAPYLDKVRAVGVTPLVVEQSRQAARRVGPLMAMLDALTIARPRLWATPALVVACVAWFALMWARGVSPWTPDSNRLIEWGANFGPSAFLGGEPWRLISGAFVHVNLLHLVMNLMCLGVLGPTVERLLGSWAFVFVYLAAGVGGSLLSAVDQPTGVSAGASGAVFGLCGALAGVLLVHRRRLPRGAPRIMASGLVLFVVVSLATGAVLTFIDQSAHVGGLLFGALGGLLLPRAWPPNRPEPPRWRAGRLLGAIVLLGLLIGAGALAAARVRDDRGAIAYHQADRRLRHAVKIAAELGEARSAYDQLDDQMRKWMEGRPIEIDQGRALIAWLDQASAELAARPIRDPAVARARDRLIAAERASIDLIKAIHWYLRYERTMTIVLTRPERARWGPDRKRSERRPFVVGNLAGLLWINAATDRLRAATTALDRAFLGTGADQGD